MSKKHTSLWITLKYSNESDGLVTLMAALVKSECQILQFNQQVLADFNFVMLDVEGLWNQLATVELQLSLLNEMPLIECCFGRYDKANVRNELLYEFELIVFNQAYALNSVLLFFREYARVLECSSRRFCARYTNENMQIIKLILAIGGDESIAYLRDRFSDFCDEHNFDAVLEPIKY